MRITGAAASHLGSSLRARPGETIVVVDAYSEHGVVLDEVTRSAVTGSIAWSRDATGEPRLRAHVLQALPQRGMGEAVEAMSQIGASEIHPLLTHRTIPQPEAASADRRLERWRTIAREAAQLAGRAAAPVVHPLATIEQACAALPEKVLLLAADPAAAQSIARLDLSADRPLAIAIGPEGGFDEHELAVLDDSGAVAVHLGARVLPARLAGALALCLALARSGDLDAAAVPPPKI